MSTAFILGPVFFTLLRNSLKSGTTAGVLTAIGILLSDILVMVICLQFAGNFIDQYVNLPIVKFIAAFILFYFAYVFYSKPIHSMSETDNSVAQNYFNNIWMGFIVNFANPAVFLIWISFIALSKSQYVEGTQQIIFLVGILVGVFVTDFAKAVGASYLSPYLKSEWLSSIFKILAVIIGLAGLYLIYQGVVDWL